MPNIFSSNYLSRKPIEKAMKKFAENFSPNQEVLDIGCGNKPYEKYFKCKYVGLDPFPDTKADLVANAWEIPVEDSKFDGIILNQSLEHIQKTSETIKEIYRILKPGGLCIVTVPQTMRNHGNPIPSEDVAFNFDKNKIPYWNDDYFRFTKFGLIYLFRDFEILALFPNQSYLTTLIQLWNYFLASFNFGVILAPIYLFNNITAIMLNAFSSLLSKNNYRYKALVHEGLTVDHTLITKKK